MPDELRRCYPYRLCVAISAAFLITGGMICAFVVPGVMFSLKGFDIMDNPIPVGCAVCGGFLFMVSGFLLTGLCNRLYAYGQLHTFYANHAGSFVGPVNQQKSVSRSISSRSTAFTATPRTPGSATPAKVKIPPWEQTWRSWVPPPPPIRSLPPTPQPQEMQKCKTMENLIVPKARHVTIAFEEEDVSISGQPPPPKRSASTQLNSHNHFKRFPTFDALPPSTPPILEEGVETLIFPIPKLQLATLEGSDEFPPPPPELLQSAPSRVKKVPLPEVPKSAPSKSRIPLPEILQTAHSAVRVPVPEVPQSSKVKLPPPPPKRGPDTKLHTFQRSPSPDPLPPPPPELLVRHDSLTPRFDLPSPQPLVVKAQQLNDGTKTLPLPKKFKY